jgi:hypothetical protein
MTSGIPAEDRLRQNAGRPSGDHQARHVTTPTKEQATEQATEQVKGAGREAAGSTWLQAVGRLGLICRGVLYGLIGFLALQIAFGHGGQEADQSGALQAVSGTPLGAVVLWLLVVGFAGLALWQLTVAVFDSQMELKDRLASGARVVMYTALCITAVLFLTGSGQAGTDQRSQSATAEAMQHTGGRFLVGAAGLALVILGIVWASRGVRRHFLKHLDLSGASPRTRRVVEMFGLIGNVARGVVFGAVGVFVLQAAATFDPEKAKGLDGSLRSLADAPLGPLLLVLLALGLIVFGVYSCLQARFQRPHAAAASS